MYHEFMIILIYAQNNRIHTNMKKTNIKYWSLNFVQNNCIYRKKNILHYDHTQSRSKHLSPPPQKKKTKNPYAICARASSQPRWPSATISDPATVIYKHDHGNSQITYRTYGIRIKRFCSQLRYSPAMATNQYDSDRW